jgi:hypothetical protein
MLMRISLFSGRAAGDGEHSDEVQSRADAGLDVDLTAVFTKIELFSTCPF